MEIIAHQSLISCLTSKTYGIRDEFSLSCLQNIKMIMSNNEQSLVLDFRDHSHAECGRYFFTREREGEFCREGRLHALENLKTQLVMAYPVDLIAQKMLAISLFDLKINTTWKKKDLHKNKFSSHTTVSIVIFNCNPHCNYNNNSDDTNLLFWTRA